MRSNATTPAEYIRALPPERQAVVKRLRQELRKNLPLGFEETMEHGMIAYVVPHRLYPAGYHCDPERPLPFVNLASQKRHVSLYHLGLYDGPLSAWLESEWPKHTTAKLQLGKCCLRFTQLDRVPYALVAELATKLTPRDWIELYERVRAAAR